MIMMNVQDMVAADGQKKYMKAITAVLLQQFDTNLQGLVFLTINLIEILQTMCKVRLRTDQITRLYIKFYGSDPEFNFRQSDNVNVKMFTLYFENSLVRIWASLNNHKFQLLKLLRRGWYTHVK